MAVVKSTEMLVPTGFPAFARKAQNSINHEKISCSLTESEAVVLLGKTVLVELAWHEDPEPLWRCVHIAGVVLTLQGIYHDPHFMVFSATRTQTYPDEMFWSHIRTLKVLEARSS